MYNHILYLVFLITNALVFFVVSFLFPENVVVGNARFTAIEAAIYAGFWVTFLIWVMWDFAQARGFNLNDSKVAYAVFWGINTVSIWLVARLSHLVGLGISSFVWAIILGGLTDILHRQTWATITRPKN